LAIQIKDSLLIAQQYEKFAYLYVSQKNTKKCLEFTEKSALLYEKIGAFVRSSDVRTKTVSWLKEYDYFEAVRIFNKIYYKTNLKEKDFAIFDSIPQDADFVVHTASENEGFGDIAQLYQVDETCLKNWNIFIYGKALEGQRIRICKTKDWEKGEIYSTIHKHSIQRGESFASIAQKYTISLDAIKKINGFVEFPTPKVGDEVLIQKESRCPCEKIAEPEAPKVSKKMGLVGKINKKDIPEIHVVQGYYENMQNIAEKYGLIAEKLAELNGLSIDATLFPETKIRLK